jgi:hypothetical protein
MLTNKYEIKPMVFICSPFAGDIEHNLTRARGYCRFAVSKNAIPIAPHLLFPQFMDDDDATQRDNAISMGLVLMSQCRELWCFGTRISNGMIIELENAKQRNIPIRYFSDTCEEVEKSESDAAIGRNQ